MTEFENTNMGQHSTVYASVDLELSGFDPETDEIIEVGVSRFAIENGTFVVIDSFGSLVRPSGSVRTRVLGLTGIDEVAVKDAPLWSAVQGQVQELLGDAVIVGHGVDLDVRFLRAKGVQCGEKIIDTLELSQIFLPTHHSYNLENLAHELGAQHATAHRALADAEATMGILEKMCGIFRGLTKETRDRLLHIAKTRALTWEPLLEAAYAVPVWVGEAEGAVKQVPEFAPQGIAQRQASVPAWVFAFAERERVLEIAKCLGVNAYLGAFEYVSPQAAERLENDLMTLDHRALLALCKVIVWQARGPAFGILAELNWSIIGTEQKKLFTSGFSSRPPSAAVATDFRSLLDFRESRHVWIGQIDLFTQFLEQKSGTQLTWYGLIGLLRQIYNHDLGSGDAAEAAAVMEAVAHVDAYFATAQVLLRSELGSSEGVLSFDDMGHYMVARLHNGAVSLVRKLVRLFPRYSREGNLFRYLQSLETFFEGVKPGSVRWLEYGDGRCAFVGRSLNLAEYVLPLVRQHRTVQFQTDIRSTKLLELFSSRLGVSLIDKAMLDIRDKKNISSKCVIVDGSIVEEVTQMAAGAKSALILFPTVSELKKYYDENFSRMNAPFSVVAVGIHGGVQKVLRNFSHNNKTVVLAAVSQMAAYGGAPLHFESIIFVGVPKVESAHPFVRSIAVEYFSSPEECVKYLCLLAFTQCLRPIAEGNDCALTLLSEPSNKDLATFLLREVL